MVKIHQISLQGKRPSNEDEHVIFLNKDKTYKTKNFIDLIAVFDGHGGPLVSKFAKNNLPKYFTKKKSKLFLDCDMTIKYINKVFNNFNNKLEKSHPKAAYYSGTTCCMAVLCNDNKNDYLWIINAGDSRAVLGNKIDIAVPLSHDHKPNVPTERKRIEALEGGKDKIYYDGVDWRVVDLSLSRALGDLEAHPYVSVLPQVYRYKINPKDKFIVVACDGVWDVLDNQKVIDLLNDNKDKNINLAKLIAEKALDKGSTDNITCIVYEI